MIQTWLNWHLFSERRFPEYVAGYVKGRDIFDHARHHAKSRNPMILDIEDFFSSVTEEMVRTIFESLGFPGPVATQLMRLTTFNGRLPQGAPTSPTLASIAFLGADSEIQNLAIKSGCTYARYADDLTFSGDLHFTQEHVKEINSSVTKQFFRTNPDKTRIVGKRGRPLVTGLVVNSGDPRPLRKNVESGGQCFIGQESTLANLASGCPNWRG